MKKLCKKCGRIKNLKKFHKEKLSRDGRQAYCKKCCVGYGISRNNKNKEKVKMAVEVLRTFEEEYPVEYKIVIEKINERNTERSLA